MTEKQEKTENDNTRAIKEMEQENNDLAEEKNNFEVCTDKYNFINNTATTV